MTSFAVIVTMMKSSCAQSYIREKTLEQNRIKWQGTTVILRWKSMAIRGDEDQMVQQTRFHVVDETVANEAGFRFDMLVGADHDVPIHDQVQALGADETSSAGLSVIDQTEDPAAHAFEDSRGAELRPMSVDYRGPQPAASTMSITGTGREVANFIKELGAVGDVASTAAGSSTGRFVESRIVGCGKRKLSYTDDSGGPSRKLRFVENTRNDEVRRPYETRRDVGAPVPDRFL